MTKWNDDRLAMLIADAMASHEGDVDPERARELALTRAPARRHWPAVTAAAAAVVLVSGLGVFVVGRTSDHAVAPASPSTSSGGDATGDAATETTTEENYQLALAASEAAVASMPVPERSVQLNGEPDNWPGAAMALGPSDGTLTRTRWWSVPMSDDDLAAFLADHAPAGMQRVPGEDVVVDGDSYGIGYTDYDVVEPADPAAYSGPSLLVQFKQIGVHTVLRVDSFIASRHAVSAQHRITDDVVAVTIERVRPEDGGDGGGGELPVVQLTAPGDAEQIGRLVDAFNGLYGSTIPAPMGSCPWPGDPRPQDKVTFETAGGATVVADWELACWGQVQVTVDGDPLDVTLDPQGLDVVDEIADAVGAR